MSKRCPPGVICFENMTIAIIILLVGLIVMFLYFNNKFTIFTSSNNINKRTIIRENINNNQQNGLYPKPIYSYSNISNDVLLNPYSAPLRDNSHNHQATDSSDIRGMPINISTQAIESSYRQVGILTRINGQEMILPLMGKPLMTHRDKWNFYTMSDKNNMIKLPVIVNGKSGTVEYGVDNIYNGDTVYVEGYNDAFKATIYENNLLRYIPYL